MVLVEQLAAAIGGGHQFQSQSTFQIDAQGDLYSGMTDEHFDAEPVQNAFISLMTAVKKVNHLAAEQLESQAPTAAADYVQCWKKCILIFENMMLFIYH